MKTLTRIAKLSLFGLLPMMLLLLSGQAFSQVRRASIKELTQESTAILVGKCSNKESFWNEKRTKIFTQVKIQTEKIIKGQLEAEAVITIPGGRVGNTLYEVSDMPTFVEGEEVLVFLWRHPSGKNLVTGALQGKLTVVKDKKTGKKLLRGAPIKLEEEKSLAKSATTRTAAPKKIFLEDFIKEVKGYLNN